MLNEGEFELSTPDLVRDLVVRTDYMKQLKRRVTFR